MGHLFLVATPIGNLGDMTKRAVDTLGEVDLIACEDTRHTGKLLMHLGIKTPMTSFHEHTRPEKLESFVEKMKAGARIALVADRGTPLISDPGFPLVRRAIEEGIPVEAIPGPVAFVAALTMSGLPTHRFHFEGFLPKTSGKLKARLESLKEYPDTLVFYETPHRLLKVLPLMREILGERRASVSRELTKLHEETVRGDLSEIQKHFEKHAPRGEFVIVIGGTSS